MIFVLVISAWVVDGCTVYDDAPSGKEAGPVHPSFDAGTADTGKTTNEDVSTDRAMSEERGDFVTGETGGNVLSDVGAADVFEAAVDAMNDVATDTRPEATLPDRNCTPPNRKAVLPSGAIISDLEGGNVIQAFAPGGYWYNLNDGSVGGVEKPDPFAVSAIMPVRATSTRGVHTTGTGFVSWGGGVAFQFVQTGGPVDMSQYSGISFWAMWTADAGPASIRVNVVTEGTLPDYCVCPTVQCNDHFGKIFTLTSSWAQYTMTWAQLAQAGWGFPVAFDPKAAIGMNFVRAQATGDWDFWVDDVAFMP
jgi:hypothetical protein